MIVSNDHSNNSIVVALRFQMLIVVIIRVGPLLWEKICNPLEPHDVYFFLFVAIFLSSALGGHPFDPRFCFFFVQFFVFPCVASPFTCIFLSFWQVCFCSAKGDTPLDPRFFFFLQLQVCEYLFHFPFACWLSVCNGYVENSEEIQRVP